jgi:hypothetical protein
MPSIVHMISIFLGLFLTIFVFVGGINIERTALTFSHVDNELLLWSSFYYIVGFMSFHHSMETFFPYSKKTCTAAAAASPTPSTSLKDNRSNSLNSIVSTVKSMKNIIVNDVISSRGKYFFLRFYLKEFLEVGFQLAGVINSESETEAYPAFFTSFFVGLNLILV